MAKKRMVRAKTRARPIIVSLKPYPSSLQPAVIIWKDSAFSVDSHPGPIIMASTGFITHIDEDGNITLAQDVDSTGDPRSRITILAVNMLRITTLRTVPIPEFQ
jgi:hypothetical protein